MTLQIPLKVGGKLGRIGSRKAVVNMEIHTSSWLEIWCLWVVGENISAAGEENLLFVAL